MASVHFNDVSRRLKDSLLSRFENGKFATTETPERVLTSDNLRLVYRSLATSDAAEKLAATIDEDGFVKNTERKKLHTFLAVLLFANCSAHAVCTFVSKLVHGDTVETAPNKYHWKGPSYSLPADKAYLAYVFDNNTETVQSFYHAQLPFSTVVLRANEHVRVQNDEPYTLPYLEEERKGKGSFGDVYKVTIAEGHFWTGSNPNRKNKVVARKDYVYEEDAKQGFEDEKQAMAKIFSGILKHDNILQSLGTLEIQGKTPKFSLFMPLAIEDLNTYMNTNRDTIHVAAGTDARRRLIRSAFGLAEGLQYLHQGIVTPDGKELVCYHMDLKPANILLFKDDRPRDETPHKDDRIWKISDFGISRVKGIQTAAGKDREVDLRDLFKSTSKDKKPGALPTYNQRGKGTYLPSESEMKTKVMNHKSDVWSLGCIIGELFTYMEEGSQGLEAYRGRRFNGEADVFYQRGWLKNDFGIKKAVESQHKELIKAAGKRTPWEKQAVRFMLDFLENRVLQTNKDKRCNSANVVDHLKETYRRYTIQDPEPEKTVSTPRLKERIWRSFSRRPSASEIVEKWKLRIDNTTSLRGCESSPDGAVIAYWSDSKIFVILGSASTSDERSHRTSESDSRSDSVSKPFFEILSQLGAVSVIIVWACQCLAYIRFHHCIREHEAYLTQEGIHLVRDRMRESGNYPFRSHLQPVLAYLALAGCLIILIVCNGSFMWRKFHIFPFLSGYLMIFLFLALWFGLKVFQKAPWSFVDLNKVNVKEIIEHLDELRSASMEQPESGSETCWTSIWDKFASRRDGRS